MSPLEKLQICLSSLPQVPYATQSRVHPLRSFQFPSTFCSVKREDELSCGVSGSKIRKYRSLIPFFLQTGIKEVVLIGSAYSNHVLGLSQLLIENGIQPTLFLRGDPTRLRQGNLLFTSLFVSSSALHWFSKTEWKLVQEKAQAYAQQQTHPVYVLPEGGAIAEALPGALSLVVDILRNEQERGKPFDHLFLEAGTGFTASALIMGLQWLNKATIVHVLLLAEDSEAFLSQLTSCHQAFIKLMQSSVSFPERFVLHAPQLTGSFGKLSSALWKQIQQLARNEGFLADPIYTAKLFIEGHHCLQQEQIQGEVLFIHSGGTLTLAGFQEQLSLLEY